MTNAIITLSAGQASPIAMQTAVGVEREVASAPTLWRLESWSDRETAVDLDKVLVGQFVASFKTAPEEFVQDFDATDNPLYGQQKGRFFPQCGHVEVC